MKLNLEVAAGAQIPSFKAFDYSLLAPEFRAQAEAVADKIRGRLKSAKQSVFHSGKDLRGVRDGFTQGQWGDYLAAEFDLSPRSAYHWIDASIIYEKHPAVEALSLGTIYKLGASSTPDAALNVVLGMIAAGHLPTQNEVEEIIAAHKEAPAALKSVALPNPLHPVKKITGLTVKVDTPPVNYTSLSINVVKAEPVKDVKAAELQAEIDAEIQAADDAFDMVKAALGDQLAEFAAKLMPGTAIIYFKNRLKEVVAS